MQKTIDEQLSRRVSDADVVEDLVEIIGHKAISGPLREEGNSNNNPNTLAVSRSHKQRFPSDVISDGAVELKSRFNFFEFVLHKRILSERYK